MFFDQPNDHIDSGSDQCDKKANSESLAKTDHPTIVFITVILNSNEYQCESNDHGSVADQYAVVKIATFIDHAQVDEH